MSTESIILEVIARVRAEKGLAEMRIEGSQRLGEDGLGLDSLDMAAVVAELDARLGQDPFAEGASSFETVSDFVALYADADPE